MSTTTQGGFAASGRIVNGKNEPDHLLVLVHGILARYLINAYVNEMFHRINCFYMNLYTQRNA